jgi:hypothetical protein
MFGFFVFQKNPSACLITTNHRKERKMEPVIPVEECAKQRLQVLVYAYSLFIKHLKDEGVDREKVKRASDKVWAILGNQAAEQMKPLFGESINLESLQQAGAIAEYIHGMEVSQKMSGSELHTEVSKCPWQDANLALGMPEEWWFCSSGHETFTKTMYKALDKNASYTLTKKMPGGDQICEGVSAI